MGEMTEGAETPNYHAEENHVEESVKVALRLEVDGSGPGEILPAVGLLCSLWTGGLEDWNVMRLSCRPQCSGSCKA